MSPVLSIMSNMDFIGHQASRKKRIFDGQADRKGWPPPPLGKGAKKLNFSGLIQDLVLDKGES